MSIFEIIKARRSIRNFLDKPVEKSKIKKIIQAGQWAPSACNIQGWRFIIITDKEIKKRIKEENVAYFIEEAPVLILVVYDNRTENIEYKDHIQSASAAIQNILLESEELGLGACWTNNLPPKRILRKILKIPQFFDPIALIALGYYEKKPKPLKRKYKLEEIIAYNEFNFPYDKKREKIFLRRLLRKMYLNLPKVIKKRLKRFTRNYEKKFDTEDRYE